MKNNGQTHFKLNDPIDQQFVSILVCALMCEARPLVDYFKLKKQSDRPFKTFADKNKSLCLIVTGIGIVNAAAAVGWMAHKTGSNAMTSVWLNIGSAGHADLEIGTAVRIRHFQFDRATNGPTQIYKELAQHVPMTVTWRGKNSALMTTQVASEDYPEEALIDMEGAAFFGAAQQFSSAELVQAIKVVTDNKFENVSQLTASKISSAINRNILPIVDFIERMQVLAKAGGAPSRAQVGFEDIHFHPRWTHSQTRLIVGCLQQCQALGLTEAAIALIKNDYTQTHKSITQLLARYVPSLDANVDSEVNAIKTQAKTRDHG